MRCSSTVQPDMRFEENEIPKIESGVIQFESVTEFANTMDKLNSGEVEYEKTFKNHLKTKGFVPLTSKNSVEFDYIYQSNPKLILKGADSTQFDLAIVEDPNFASVLNEKGIVRIDSLYFRISRDYLFWSKLENIEDIEDDQLLSELVSNETTQKRVNSTQYVQNDVYYKLIDRQNAMLSNEEGSSSYGPSQGITWYNLVFNDYPEPLIDNATSITRYHTYGSDPKRRMEAEIWNTNYYIYASFGASTHNAKKSFVGLYFDAECDSLVVQVGVEYKYKFKNPVTGVEEVGIRKEFNRAPVKDSNIKGVKDVVDWQFIVTTVRLNFETFAIGVGFSKTTKSFEILNLESKHYLRNVVGNKGYKIYTVNRIKK